jgi:hypothetical protein
VAHVGNESPFNLHYCALDDFQPFLQSQVLLLAHVEDAVDEVCAVALRASIYLSQSAQVIDPVEFGAFLVDSAVETVDSVGLFANGFGQSRADELRSLFDGEPVAVAVLEELEVGLDDVDEGGHIRVGPHHREQLVPIDHEGLVQVVGVEEDRGLQVGIRGDYQPVLALESYRALHSKLFKLAPSLLC